MGKLIDGSEFTLRALDFRGMEFGNKPTGTPGCYEIYFEYVCTTYLPATPFDMVAASFKEIMEKGYALSCCSRDSMKQTDPIVPFLKTGGSGIRTAVQHTLHEGFADNALRLCIFTDHKLFDRFHKYNLKSKGAH